MFGRLFGWQMPVRQSNNTPVIAGDSLMPPNEFQASSQQNGPEIVLDITQGPDSGREDTSNSVSELITPIYQSRKRKEPPTTSQGRTSVNGHGVGLQDMFKVDQSTWEALEEKRMKIEADTQRELFLMRIQHEKELEERRIQHEKERDERRYRLTESLFSIIMEELRSNK